MDRMMSGFIQNVVVAETSSFAGNKIDVKHSVNANSV
jgi:hypothetical protein